MIKEMPKGKWSRSWTGGKTAAKIGGKTLHFLAKKPFLKPNAKEKARQALDDETASILFQGLSLLKGTALKLAQSLSLEMDMLPESVCAELEKSYNQAPPLNAALVRKIIKTELGAAPDEIFQSFEPKAFAAASLGQVHRAVSKTGKSLAVKIQYPGIKQTISSDIQMVKAVLKTMPDGRILIPMAEEVEERLREETNYDLEAQNASFFARHMPKEDFQIPLAYSDISSKQVLAMEYIEGPELHTWLKTAPSQQERDRVANLLYSLFLYGFYESRCIHADPNPGNFIIQNNGNIGLLDFGCIKKFTPDFIECYRRFPGVIIKSNKNEYIGLMKDLRLLKEGLSAEIESKIVDIYHPISKWFAQLYKEESFDFGKNKDFFKQGREVLMGVRKLRKYFGNIDPSFVFLDRTRYGLMRLFEKMEARVRIKNMYESIE